MDPFEGRYRYCPKCGCEYRPGFEICTDCGVDLVDRLPERPDDEAKPQPDFEALASAVGSDPIEIYVTTSEINAHIVRGALVAAGIPSVVWSSGHMAYYGHVTRFVGAFPDRVMIHKDDEAEARELLATQFGDDLEKLQEPDG